MQRFHIYQLDNWSMNSISIHRMLINSIVNQFEWQWTWISFFLQSKFLPHYNFYVFKFRMKWRINIAEETSFWHKFIGWLRVEREEDRKTDRDTDFDLASQCDGDDEPSNALAVFPLSGFTRCTSPLSLGWLAGPLFHSYPQLDNRSKLQYI